MRIVSIGLTRNEGDILEAFVRHHCALFDEMIFFVHWCSDNTEEILSALIEEGLPIRTFPLTYHPGDIDGFTRLKIDWAMHKAAAILTDIMRDLASDGVDWIVPLDVDEFVSVPGRSALEEILGSVGPAFPVRMPWVTYVPTPDDDDDEPHLLRRIVHRHTGDTPTPGQRKVIVPRLAALRKNMMLSNGSHCLIDPVTMKLDLGRRNPSIALAHFPVRDEEQIRKRILSSYLMFDSSPVRNLRWDERRRRLLERCMDPRPMSKTELREIGMLYRQPDPCPRPDLVVDPVTVLAPELRYPVRRLSTWDILVEHADRLAERLGMYAKRQYEAAARGLPIGERTK